MKSFIEWMSEQDIELLKAKGFPAEMHHLVPAWFLAKIKRGEKEYQVGEKVVTRINWEGVVKTETDSLTAAKIPPNTEVQIVKSIPGKAVVRILKPTKVQIGMSFEIEHISNPEELYQVSGWQLWNEEN